jgi:hypothetical protein
VDARDKHKLPSSKFVLFWGAATSDHTAFLEDRKRPLMKLSEFQFLNNFRNYQIPFPIITAVNVPDNQDVLPEGKDFSGDRNVSRCSSVRV